jgi:cell wall-associated NlpC family hydrolase
MLLHGDLRARAFVASVAFTIAFAAIPNAQATPRKAVMEEAVTVKAPASTKTKKRKTGWTAHPIGAWHFTPRRPMSRAAIALATARAQLGKPYVWGADGPSSFDCSGLTMFAWHAAGVSLPHNSWAQQDAIKAVPVDKMQPGDLVFYPGHVGIYIGHGQMIHAPHTGANVEVAPLQSDIIGAGRPA